MPPTRLEIEDYYDRARRILKEEFDKLIESCNGDFECQQAWRREYARFLMELLTMKNSAINEHWKDTRQRRDDWEKKIRDLIPGWPDLEGIIRGRPQGQITTTLTTDLVKLPQMSGPATWTQPVSLDGTVSLTSNVLTWSAVCSGSLQFEFTKQQGSGLTGQIYSGSLFLKGAASTSLSLTVEKHEANKATLDPSGNGTISILFKRYVSEEGWNAILPSYVRLSAPISLDANNRLNINLQNASWDSLVPHQPWAITDYNKDGQRDLSTDRAAFLADWSLQTSFRSDINGDGVWDQADIDEWDNMFAEDSGS
jgi:hypothetical protein